MGMRGVFVDRLVVHTAKRGPEREGRRKREIVLDYTTSKRTLTNKIYDSPNKTILGPPTRLFTLSFDYSFIHSTIVVINFITSTLVLNQPTIQPINQSLLPSIHTISPKRGPLNRQRRQTTPRSPTTTASIPDSSSAATSTVSTSVPNIPKSTHSPRDGESAAWQCLISSWIPFDMVVPRTWEMVSDESAAVVIVAAGATARVITTLTGSHRRSPSCGRS